MKWGFFFQTQLFDEDVFSSRDDCVSGGCWQTLKHRGRHQRREWRGVQC